MSNKQDKRSIDKTGKPLKSSEIQTTFIPKFWELADNRVAIIRMVKKRADSIKQDCKADSIQKKLIAERACFVSIRLESMELDAIDTNRFDTGQYVALCNTLLGLLKSLGLDKKAKQVVGLKQYLESKEQKNN